MERYIFIHGSASGQSALSLSRESDNLCTEISKWYFEKRESRVKGLTVPCAMFVELYQANNGKRYCLYSYVCNACVGPEPNFRPGQYFAATIALQDSYCTCPSRIYDLLSSAYSQLIRNKIIADRVISGGKEYRNVYKIGQFRDQSEYLTDFLNKISVFFDEDCLNFCQPLPKSINLPLPWNGQSMVRMVQNRPEVLPWNGEIIHSKECDAITSAEKLWRDGRVYVSGDASLMADSVQILQKKNAELEKKIEGLEYKVNNPAPNPKDKKDIANLQAENAQLKNNLKKANDEKEGLEKENEELITTFEGLSQLISKQKAKTNKQLGRINNQFSDETHNSKGWKRWVKVSLLLLVFLFTLANLVFNIWFFRNSSSNSGEIGQTKVVDTIVVEESNSNSTDSVQNLTVNASSNQGGRGDSGANSATKGEMSGATTESKPCPKYGLTITDSEGKSVESVIKGQVITAKVSNPNQGLCWRLDGVKKVNSSDVNLISLEVVKDSDYITIGYGDPNDYKKRERKSLKIINN